MDDCNTMLGGSNRFAKALTPGQGLKTDAGHGVNPYPDWPISPDVSEAITNDLKESIRRRSWMIHTRIE